MTLCSSPLAVANCEDLHALLKLYLSTMYTWTRKLGLDASKSLPALEAEFVISDTNRSLCPS
jgi:hypothetical protein